MKTFSIIYHLARADFFERIRRYNFLLMLGVVLWLGYLSASGQFRLRVPPDYLGVINSAWIGATMTITATFFLGWFGFYLIKGSINRDYETGVGQIIATTPISRTVYMLGKWFSNFLVLSIMILILAIAGILMNVFWGVEPINIGSIITPMILIALPLVAFVSALAVLFESITWLRGGLGNLVYFFLFLFMLTGSLDAMSASRGSLLFPYLDFAGWQMLGNSITDAAKLAFPESSGGFAFSITPLENPNFFVWDGLVWTKEILLSRFYYLIVVIIICSVAALTFDRFNPTRIKKTKAKTSKPIHDSLEESAAANKFIHKIKTLIKIPQVKSHFLTLLFLEMKLLIKEQRWWWYLITIGLILSQYLATVENIKMLNLLAWVWPILIISGIGNRESRYNTSQIMFSTISPIKVQLPAIWFATLLFLGILGSGSLFKALSTGELTSIMGWITAVIFIPSLAFFLGIFTGNNKTFEVIYIMWMYLLTQNINALDFMGMTNESPWFIYLFIAILIMTLSIGMRKKQTVSQ